MTVWDSYKRLSPRTRVLIGAGIMGYALLGQTISDQVERVFGYTPSEEDKARLKGLVPRVTTVDKGDGSGGR